VDRRERPVAARTGEGALEKDGSGVRFRRGAVGRPPHQKAGLNH